MIMNVHKQVEMIITRAIFAVLAVVALTFWGCSVDQQASEDELVKTVNVEVQTMEPQVFERYLQLVGTIGSRNDVRISAEVSGRIEKYFVEKGQRVKQGDPILKIDDDKLLQEKARLEARAEQTREQYERLKRVFEQDSIGSEIDVINARTDFQQSKSALESVKVDLKNTMIHAPFHAVLEDRMVEVGEMASPGLPLVRLIGQNELKVTAGVPARFSDVVHVGDEVELWFEFASSDTLKLPITYVAESIDPQARTFKVDISLPHKTHNFKIDMIANVKLRTLHRGNAIVVGEEFIFQKEKGFVVYTVAENEEGQSVARERQVQLGSTYENNVIIKSGLEPGEQLITVGSSFLQDDMRIKIVENRSRELTQRN